MEKAVPREKLIGMQVIDTRGAIVGSVKDVSITVAKGDISLVLSTKWRTEIEVPWRDVQAVEDVILLSKPIERPPAPPTVPAQPQVTQGPSQISCPRCNASAPSAAKYCPKCGAKMRGGM